VTDTVDIDAKTEYVIRMAQLLWQTRREIEYIERNYLPHAPEQAEWSQNMKSAFDELRLMLIQKVNVLKSTGNG